MAKDIALLWDHPTTKKVVERKHEFQFLDSAPYFLSKAEKLVGDDYLPSDDDVLRARSMTTGIVTFPFEARKITLRESRHYMSLIRFRTKTGKEVLNSSSLTWVDRERNEENGFTALRMLLQVWS